METLNSAKYTSLKHGILLVALTLLMALPGLSNLPVIDRDEARFAQASIQMVERQDYVNIRFQDRARNKKPAGIYWMQSAMLKMFSSPDKRDIWIQRIPSTLGALLAVLATYWGGRCMIGKRAAFIGAGLLAVSAGFVFEAHIAKTDAVLCGLSALALAALARIRVAYSDSPPLGDRSAIKTQARHNAILLWFALAMSIMIKGPVLLAIVFLTLLSLALWEGRIGWMRALLYWPGPLLCVLLITPWIILIWQATDGQFFKDALIGDFGKKLGQAQETHSGPPGFYAATLWITFWPSVLFLIPGFVFALRAIGQGRGQSTSTVFAMRLLIAWVVPFWLILECVPTKLTHYIIPLFPALALMGGAAAMTLFYIKPFAISRKISALIFVIVTIAICTGILVLETLYGPEPSWSYAVTAFSGFAAILAAYSLWTGKVKLALGAMVATCMPLSGAVYQEILPSLNTVRISDNLLKVFERAELKPPRLGGPTLYSPHFTEPSLIYHFGKATRLGDQVAMQSTPVTEGSVLLWDRLKHGSREYMIMAVKEATKQQLCWRDIDIVKGLNYAKGEEVEITILQAIACETISGASDVLKDNAGIKAPSE